MSRAQDSYIAVCLTLTSAISHASTVEEIYEIALDALEDGLGVTRAAILLFDADGVMRFRASRGLSERYRRTVEGHTPWTPDTPDPDPIVVTDVTREVSLAPYLTAIRAEGIAAMAFVPLVCGRRVIGKFMLYGDEARDFTREQLLFARLVASQVAFAVERTQTAEEVRHHADRLRFALDAASMGTWDWNIVADHVRWSDNLERIHGLPPGTFDGSFGSYEREIHPDDRARVVSALKRALEHGVVHEEEYRIVAPDGTIRWVEGKGRVEYEHGRPVRMSGVCMNVTRRKEAELARLAAAEEANRLKDEFLATLSHELRTPLNAILGWVQLLEQNRLPAERAREAVQVIGRNARLQAQLIEDILDLSRVITGKLAIDHAPVALAPLVQAVVAGVRPQAEAKGLAVECDVAPDVPAVSGDARRLHQVLGNILSNAVKFTPAGGHVRVRCWHDGGRIGLEVRDTGVGIAPEFAPYVFDRFRQGDSRSTRVHGGLGLGLAIAQHLVDMHGGTIEAQSDGIGHGTTVTVRLPASAGEERHEPAATTDSDPCEHVRLDGTMVLVVDDERDSREMLRALLEQCGATVVESDGATGALDTLQREPVDLIVADIGMPDIDGYGLVRRVRAMGMTTPALALTAYAHAHDRGRALDSGFNAYYVKPVDVNGFLRAVGDTLGR